MVRGVLEELSNNKFIAALLTFTIIGAITINSRVSVQDVRLQAVEKYIAEASKRDLIDADRYARLEVKIEALTLKIDDIRVELHIAKERKP